jgi:predicted amidohydrolase YtcJ
VSGGSVLFRDVQVQGARCDVHVVDGTVREIQPRLRPTGLAAEHVVDAAGGALLPGLHDHHVHLASLAASLASVRVGPPDVTTAEQFAAAIAAADARLAPGDWVRAIGYHESVAGRLDRDLLDRLAPGRAVRVQDRSGKRWTLSSAALAATGADLTGPPGIERDGRGRATGPIEREDDWLAAAIGGDFPDLAAVGSAFAAVGVTHLTDCTPYGDPAGPASLAAALRSGALPQTVYVTGGVELAARPVDPLLRLGPVKVILDEDRLPDLATVVEWIRTAHAAQRTVAVHVVTAASLAYALAAWQEAGVRRGDRIEHGSVITPGAVERIAELGLTVVTQPGFVLERGDRYLVDVAPDEREHLYRCGSLLAHGVPVAGSSDAPYTDPDPWAAVRTAMDRRTRGGQVLGAAEGIALEQAIGLFTGDPLDPGRNHRRVVVGAPADLCLLDRPLEAGLRPDASHVRATYRAGVRL